MSSFKIACPPSLQGGAPAASGLPQTSPASHFSPLFEGQWTPQGLEIKGKKAEDGRTKWVTPREEKVQGLDLGLHPCNDLVGFMMSSTV